MPSHLAIVSRRAASLLGSVLFALTLVAAPAVASEPVSESVSESGPAAATDDPLPAAPEPVVDARRPRKFFGFVTDAAVTPGLWAEIGQLYRQDEYSDFWTLFTVAYGWRDWEFGGETAAHTDGEFDAYDLGLWGKYVGWKLGEADVGAGLHIGVPLLGGSVDVAPFATASLPFRGWDLRSSFGYVITEDFLFNAAALRSFGESIDFRAEFDTSFDTSFRWNVRLVPGVDFHFVRGRWDFLVRASMGAELNPDQAFLAALSFVLSES